MNNIQFNTVKAIDFCDDVRDGTHDSPRHLKTGRILITSKNIKGNAIDFEKVSFISENDFNKINERSLVEINDILYSMIGTVGLVYRVDKEPNYAIKNMGLFKIKDETKSKWLYYYLNSLKSKQKVISKLSGSTQKFISLRNLRNLEIEYPCNKQDMLKIIKLCEMLDKKIKINNKINDCLFNLINLNYNKYLDEVSKLESADEIAVKDLFDFESGIEPGSKNYLKKEDKDTIKFYRVGDMDSDCKTFIKKDLANNKILNENDIVVSFDATIGRIGYGLNGSFSTGMKKINVNSKYKNIIDNSIIYAYFNNIDTQHKILENAKGTTILHAGSAINFLNFKYNEDLLIKYNKIISVFFQRIKHIKKENENLSNLRNTLLPKLMNGEINLSNVEI